MNDNVEAVDMFDVLIAAVEYVVDTVASFVDAVMPLIELAVKLATSFAHTCYSVYEAVGAPYGPDTDGMFRWIEEYLETGRLIVRYDA